MNKENIKMVKENFYNIKKELDSAHMKSVEQKKVEAKIVLEHLILDFHIKKDIIEEIDPNEEFYEVLDRWINAVDDILKQFYPELKGRL